MFLHLFKICGGKSDLALTVGNTTQAPIVQNQYSKFGHIIWLAGFILR